MHTDLALIFNITTALHAGRSFPHIFHIYTNSTATPTYNPNFSSVVANSKICRGRSKNSSVVESQGYFVLKWPFLQFHEQRAKFANEVNHPTKNRDTPYLSLYSNSMKQNDVTMTFPVNSSLQCFRTAALSMVTYVACDCRKPLQNVKILRCQWVKGLHLDSHIANNYPSLSRDVSLGCEFI